MINPAFHIFGHQVAIPARDLGVSKTVNGKSWFPGSVLPIGNKYIGLLSAAQRMENLELVVTVDTVTAHLAGALGKTVWTLLPFEGDWRWMMDRTDSPWYPTMRLFRQRNPGEWGAALEELRDAAVTLSD